MEPASDFDELIERIAAWAAGRPDLRGALLVGSRARSDTPADAWSDADVVLVADDPARYLDDAGWIDALGPAWVTFLESAAVGGAVERRVLFAGGLDVDFVVVPSAGLDDLLAVPEVAGVVRRGARVLLDVDGALSAALERLPAPIPPRHPRRPRSARRSATSSTTSCGPPSGSGAARPGVPWPAATAT
ncbi:MAG: aminoglycoside 6-adenylyltransferase [Thermomicrobiaceae bacterium]|nr:aminoglycoside 6-adenylyltransferase [Thermomicrobiaceae bacterium]